MCKQTRHGGVRTHNLYKGERMADGSCYTINKISERRHDGNHLNVSIRFYNNEVLSAEVQ